MDFVGIELAVSAVSDAAVAQDFAALQLDVAKVGELLLLRKSRCDECDENGDMGEERARFHDWRMVEQVKEICANTA